MVWEARSHELNGRRSPNLNARTIDIFSRVAAEADDETKFLVWQFLTYDADPNVTHNVYYWDSFDKTEQQKLTAWFKDYKEAVVVDADQDNKTRGYETEWRNPGRSGKVWDKHLVDFQEMTSVNKIHDSPRRAIRIVMVEPIPDPQGMGGRFGDLEIDDNNQCFTFQFHDHNNGWKFFAQTSPTSSNRRLRPRGSSKGSTPTSWTRRCGRSEGLGSTSTWTR